MAEFHVSDMCRLCLNTAVRLKKLTQHLTNIISTCFSLKICMSSDLSKKICHVCVEQLENVYKYRKKIIRNELILRKKIKEHIANYSVNLHHQDSQKDSDADKVSYGIESYNFSELKDVIKVVDNEYHPCDSNIDDSEENNAGTEKNDQAIILKTNDDITELKIQNSGSPLVNVWHDFKTDDKEQDDISTIQNDITVDELNDSLRHRYGMKSNILDVTKNSIERDEIQSIGPMKFESVNQIDATQETNKENTDMNNLTNNFAVYKNDNATVFNNQYCTGIVQNGSQSYGVDTDKKYMCLTCSMVFESQKELSVHYKTVELVKAVKDTSRSYKDLNIVKVLKNDGGKTVFKCGICSKVFENKASGIKHTLVHKVERPFICNLCNRTYKTVDDILRHGVVHYGNKFVCSYHCGYTTVHLGALREHVKRHKKEFKYKCDKCSKCFQVKTWFDQHQNVHAKVRPFVCKLCGQAFSMARYLTAHRANVHPQSSQVKRYKCGHCALPCDSRKCLVMHMKQKHGLKTDCLCDVCGQILPDQQKLILHKSVHEASRKYSCRFCKKSFNKKDHKTVHEKIHTGERLSCNHCPKSFTQRCSLRRHIKRYHEGDQQKTERKT